MTRPQRALERPWRAASRGRRGARRRRSWDLQLNLEGPDAGEGDYLRAFGAELVPDAVAPGAWEGTVTATMSTSSLSEWSDPTAGFAGELVRIGAPDALVEHWVAEGTHPTGPARTGPTIGD